MFLLQPYSCNAVICISQQCWMRNSMAMAPGRVKNTIYDRFLTYRYLNTE